MPDRELAPPASEAPSSPLKPYKCPKCPETFIKLSGLGSHLRVVHGVHGKSKTALAFKKKREAAGRPGRWHEKANKSKFKCPECGERFKFSQVLGRHRRYSHGVMGSSYEALKRNGLRCPQCDFKVKNEKGLAIHLSQVHGVPGANARKNELSKLRRMNGQAGSSELVHIPAVEGGDHAQQNGRDLAAETLAVAYGRFQEFCRNFAEEYDLPARSFAARFSEFVYATAVRKSLGDSHRLSALR